MFKRKNLDAGAIYRDEVTTVVQRLLIPYEYTRAFDYLFQVFFKLLNIEHLLRVHRSAFAPDDDRVVEALREALSDCQKQLIEGFRELVPKQISTDELMSQIDHLRKLTLDLLSKS